MKVKVKQLNERAQVPEYETLGASGMDVRACFPQGLEHITIMPAGIALVPTGLQVSIPQGYEIQVRSRSGLALKHGIIVLNSPGTIDSDYRGEIGIILCNLNISGQTGSSYVVRHGDRIAQLVLSKVERIEWDFDDDLGESERGGEGFGSTGKK